MRRVLKDIDPSLRRGGMTLIEVMLAAVLLIIVVLTLSGGLDYPLSNPEERPLTTKISGHKLQ